MSNGIWAGLQSAWASDKFQAISKINKTNRQKNIASASTIYRGGSASISKHKRKLLWLEAIGGGKKGRVWGMGSEARLSTSHTSTTTNTPNPTSEHGESELVQKLLIENKTMLREIKQTQKEMQMLKKQFASKFGSTLDDVIESEDDSSDDDLPSDQPPVDNCEENDDDHQH
ncbi:UNVERIFIED_CONTAM: hypothetical protein Sradi_4065200 [Sesamum radiatum]|uniref:Uncharacterized protein n=1 Tax=Sesamum radiatum TaxID=300843 RepID=A0AAW2PM79_SESRA